MDFIRGTKITRLGPLARLAGGGFWLAPSIWIKDYQSLQKYLQVRMS